MSPHYTMYCSPGKFWDHLVHWTKVRPQRKTNEKQRDDTRTDISAPCGPCFSFCGQSTELISSLAGTGQVAGVGCAEGTSLQVSALPSGAEPGCSCMVGSERWAVCQPNVCDNQGGHCRGMKLSSELPCTSCHRSLWVMVGQYVSTSETGSVRGLLVGNDHLAKCHLHHGAAERRHAASSRTDAERCSGLGVRRHTWHSGKTKVKGKPRHFPSFYLF